MHLLLPPVDSRWRETPAHWGSKTGPPCGALTRNWCSFGWSPEMCKDNIDWKSGEPGWGYLPKQMDFPSWRKWPETRGRGPVTTWPNYWPRDGVTAILSHPQNLVLASVIFAVLCWFVQFIQFDKFNVYVWLILTNYVLGAGGHQFVISATQSWIYLQLEGCGLQYNPSCV